MRIGRKIGNVQEQQQSNKTDPQKGKKERERKTGKSDCGGEGRWLRRSGNRKGVRAKRASKEI